MPANPPVIGACMPVELLAGYRDWLFDKDRDVELQSFAKAATLEGDWQPLVDEARRQLDGHKGRIGIHGPFWGLPMGSMDPAIRAAVSRRILQALDVCAALGAVQMVLHSPFTHWTYNNFSVFPERWADIADNIHQTLAPAIGRAEDLGLVMVLENIEDHDPTDRVRVAQAIGSPSVRVSLDTGHAECARGMTGAPPVDYYVVAAGEMLDHVHLQDCDGYADRHWPLGQGTIRWHSVFKAIGRLDRHPHLLLELRDHAKIPEAMAYLEREGLAQ